jgi:putative ABC transport system substrate-binding protein
LGLGWVEGRNVAFEWRYWEGRPEDVRAAAAELVRLGMDLIITDTGQGALAAKAATTTIPIVMMNSGDAVAAGIVTSLARPGGNVTGMTSVSPELAAKRLQLLRAVLPRAALVGVLRCRTEIQPSPPDSQWEETQAAARILNVKLLSFHMDVPEDAERAFKAASDQRAEAILVFDCSRNFPSAERIVELAARRRLPVVYPFGFYVSKGGLMSYGSDVGAAHNRRALTYVDRILKGAKPADLPVEQPTTFALVINLKTAKALGLSIPPSVLRQATEVIQ